MKRLAGALVATVAVVVLTGSAAADDQVPAGSPWGGSNVTPVDPVTGPSDALTVTGQIQNNTDLTYTPPTVTVTFSTDPDNGCAVAPAGPATVATLDRSPTFDPQIPAQWKRYAYTAHVPFAPNRNGTYRMYVCINDVPRLDTDILVRLPAPTVTNLVATAAGSSVNLTWDDMRGAAPDLAGYRVDRRIGDGAFAEVVTLGPESPTFTDTTLPASGGEATYQVVGLRPLVGPATPSNAAAATFAPGSTGGPGGGDGGGGTGGTGGGGTGGTGGVGSGPGVAVGRRPAGGSVAPGIRIPRVGTPSRNFFPALLAPPADAGFSEQLPYDQSGDELAGEELAVDEADELAGRGLVIPVATGLVLAVWALHLRFLARAARPTFDDRVEIIIE